MINSAIQRGCFFAIAVFTWATVVDAQICFNTQDEHCVENYSYEIFCDEITCSGDTCPGGAEASTYQNKTYRVGYSTYSGFWGTSIGQSSVHCRIEVACDSTCSVHGGGNACDGPVDLYTITIHPDAEETYEVHDEIPVGYGCPYF